MQNCTESLIKIIIFSNPIRFIIKIPNSNTYKCSHGSRINPSISLQIDKHISSFLSISQIPLNQKKG